MSVGDRPLWGDRALMLDANRHRGKFGEDYVRVLASAAGLVVYKEDLDDDGVDLGIKAPTAATRGHKVSRAIEVQVKTTSVPTWQGPQLAFDLDHRGFNTLAGARFTVPRYLVVVTVPREADRYADLFTAGMLLRNTAYFLSLQDRDPLPATGGRKRVKLPAANVLTVTSLRGLVGA